MPGQRLAIGRLGAAHGLAGELAFKPYFAGSDALFKAERVFVVDERGAREMRVERARPHAQRALVKLAGIDDRTQAEALTGATLEVDRALLPPLADGEYYLIDLVGAEVFGPDGLVGTVKRVLTHPTVDAVEVELWDGRSAEQPLAAPFVSKVDAAGGRIELANLDGLVV